MSNEGDETMSDLSFGRLWGMPAGEVERDNSCGESIEITPEMVEAAAEVLWRYPLLDIGEGLAERFAREMLERALSAREAK